MAKQTYIKVSIYLAILLVWLFSLLMLAVFIFATLLGYEESLQFLLSQYSKLDRLEEFRISYLSPFRFQVMRWVALGLSLVTLGLGYVLYRYRQHLSSYVYGMQLEIRQKLWVPIRAVWQSLSWFEKRFIIVFFIGLTLYRGLWAWYFPFHIDEIASYLFFVDKGFGVTVSYYPNTNNHVFYNVLCVFLKPLVSDPIVLMRIPTFVAGSLASLSLFWVIKRYCSFSLALLGVTFFSFSTAALVYTGEGRGYMLMTLLVLIGTYATYRLGQMPGDRLYRWLFVVSSILGFYTLIVFAYPFLSWLFFLVWHGRKEWRLRLYPLLKDLSWIGAGVCVLYLPIFLMSGIRILFSNPTVISMSWEAYIEQFPAFMDTTFNFLLDTRFYPAILGWLILSLAVVILYKYKKVHLWTLLSSCTLLPFIIISLQRFQSYERIWTYMLLFLTVAFVAVVQYLGKSIKERTRNLILYGMVAGLMIRSCLISYHYFHYELGVYERVQEHTDQLVQSGARHFFCRDYTYNLYLRLNARLADEDYILDMVKSDLATDYDYVIVPMEESFPSHLKVEDYTPHAMSNAYVNVYKHI